jgi:hypothetical protein
VRRQKSGETWWWVIDRMSMEGGGDKGKKRGGRDAVHELRRACSLLAEAKYVLQGYEFALDQFGTRKPGSRPVMHIVRSFQER